MDGLSLEFDTSLVESRDLQSMKSVLKDLLTEFGKQSEEPGDGYTLSFFTSRLERFYLTAQEPEISECQQIVNVFSIKKDNAGYKKGLYVDVWTNLGDDDHESMGIYFWRNTQYGILKNGECFVTDEFRTMSRAEISRSWYGFENEGVPESIRLKDILMIDDALGPYFTIADYVELSRVIDSFDSENLL